MPTSLMLKLENKEKFNDMVKFSNPYDELNNFIFECKEHTGIVFQYFFLR